MSVEVHDKRFGVIAVEKGFVTKEQLYEALRIQVEEEVENKNHNLIGIILMRLGYLTKEQAEAVLDVIRKRKE